jgi:hypothetical protein
VSKPTIGQAAYEMDLEKQPMYSDGTSKRPSWDDLSEIAQWSWNRPDIEEILDAVAEERPKKKFTNTCKFCGMPLVLDSCNTGADRHRTCGLAASHIVRKTNNV